MNLRNIDLPNLDTLRLLWILARRREAAAPERAMSIEAAMPEMWYPHLVNIGISQGFSSYHPGYDWPIATSTPLYAMFGGQVTQAGSYATLKGYAYRVTVVKGNWGFTYGHMLPNGFDVRVGQWVEPKQYLGRSDNTGNSTGPHLHAGVFNLSRGGDYGGGNINFLPYLQRWTKDTPPTEPPPAPPPASTGVLWYVAKSSPLSVYASASKFSPVISHMQPGQRFYGARSGEWIQVATGGWVMRRNGSKILCRKV